jgi:hypothetical protein
LVGTSPLPVVTREFLFSAHRILDVAAILPVV